MSSADIADTMRERFENAGRPADEAEAAAGMLSTFYSTMAARTGRSINDLLKIAPLPEVRRGGQPDMSAQALAQAARTATDTPEFREWFGDSVVKNSDGSPKVVYHGTTEDFNAFATGDGGVAADSKGAIFFTSKAEVAEDFSGYLYVNDPKRGVVRQPMDGANIIPVFLKMEDPVVW